MIYDDKDLAAFASDDKDETACRVLDALDEAKRQFREWNEHCDMIDEVYSLMSQQRNKLFATGTQDSKYDLFWASFEILKPATYARAPKPVVSPFFGDNKPIYNVTSELLERTALSTFAQNGLHDVMYGLRDDLLFTGRGVMWLVYESDGGEQKVCIEHVDRTDFRHENARKWEEVGWVAKRSWLSKKQMRERFGDGEWQECVNFDGERDDVYSERVNVGKVGVWEVWHKADNRVYWVTEGYKKLLDDAKPYLDLHSFWPCPKPAFATLERRSLVPVPDYMRYATHFSKISELTGRIYTLLNSVRMMGLIPGGGDVAEALDTLMRSNDDKILVNVPAASMTGGAGDYVQWLPLNEIATAIQGLIMARDQLINDFYQLSGISDIMRGATEAEETLGAQQLKSQFGSVRVRLKVEELQRIAADACRIACEVIAEKFSQKSMLSMSLMEIPTKRDLEKRIKEIEKAAKDELKALEQEVAQQAEAQMAETGPAQDPSAVEGQFKEAQSQIVQKYASMLAEVQNSVPIEDVVDLLRDDRARSFAFEVESDSTVMTDELQEKQTRAEFLNVFASTQQAVAGYVAMGPEGAKLAGEVYKFALQPYRVGRQLSATIDAFIDAAPAIAERMQAQQGDGDDMAAVTRELAEAEMAKAQAQMEKVKADAAYDQAETQRKMAELQIKSQSEQFQSQLEIAKLQQAAADAEVKSSEAQARVDLIRAQTIKTLNEAGVVVAKQNLDEFKSLADIEFEQAAMQQQAIDREVNQINRKEDRMDNQQARNEDRDFQREQAQMNQGAE